MEVKKDRKDDLEINAQLRKKFRAEKKEIAAVKAEEDKVKNFAEKLVKEKPIDRVSH